MPTPEKAKAIDELEARMSAAKCAVLTDFRGVTVEQDTKLRRKLVEAGVDYKVVKNTLAKIAAEKAGIHGLEQYFEGPTAIAFSDDDPVAPAKIIADFARESKILQIKGGVLNGEAISKEQVTYLATLPPKEVLVAKLTGALQSPIYGLVNVLSGPARNLVWTLEAIRKQKEEAGGAQPAQA